MQITIERIEQDEPGVAGIQVLLQPCNPSHEFSSKIAFPPRGGRWPEGPERGYSPENKPSSMQRQFSQSFDDFGRRAIGVRDELLNLLAGPGRVDAERHALGIGEEARVPKGLGHRLAHCSDAICG